jgi:hypothetical protein
VRPIEPVRYELDVFGFTFRPLPKAYHRHHSAGANAFPAMREEQIPAASRAVAGFMNGGQFEASRSELAPSHSGQVEVQRRPGSGVTGRSLSVEEHGMPFQRFLQVALGGLAQEGVAIHKLARKRLRHLITNLVAAAPDRRSESRYLVLRIRVEDASQLAHNLLDDPRQSSAPAGMNRR